MKFGSSVTRQVLAACAIAAVCAFAGGCSSSSPSLFPSVLADPPPRADTTLSPDQVKQATDTLLFERRRLCLEQVADAGSGAPPPDCETQGGTGATPNAGTPAKP